MNEPSIFTKIISREIPAKIRYEDELFIAFDDIHPKAPVHVLLVPKKSIQPWKHLMLTTRNCTANSYRLREKWRIHLESKKITS